jgi:hypothetical protein
MEGMIHLLQGDKTKAGRVRACARDLGKNWSAKRPETLPGTGSTADPMQCWPKRGSHRLKVSAQVELLPESEVRT